MLAFYDDSAENRQLFKTAHPIEPVLTTANPRMNRTGPCEGRAAARKRWLRLRGCQWLADIITGLKFIKSIKETGDPEREAA
jgi:hypothetical protein